MRRQIWVCLVGVISLVQLSLAGDFDDNTLRLNAVSLAEELLLDKVFSISELAVLRENAESLSPIEIDQMLASRALIQISINPETRVKAHRTKVLLPETHCDMPSPWLVRIVNEGYVTASVNINLQGVPTGNPIVASLLGPKLTGAMVEYRIMQLAMQKPGLTDITLVFDVGPGTEDLGVRAELPILLRCLENEVEEWGF